MNEGILERSVSQIASKATQRELTQSFIEQITEGEKNPLDVVIAVRAAAEVLANVTKDDRVREAVLAEIDKNGGKTVSRNGVRFDQRETGVKYDYSDCCDPEYKRLSEELAALQEKVKERQKFLLGVPTEGLPMVDQETGDCYKIWPPVRMATLGYAVTFSK